MNHETFACSVDFCKHEATLSCTNFACYETQRQRQRREAYGRCVTSLKTEYVLCVFISTDCVDSSVKTKRASTVMVCRLKKQTKKNAPPPPPPPPPKKEFKKKGGGGGGKNANNLIFVRCGPCPLQNLCFVKSEDWGGGGGVLGRLRSFVGTCRALLTQDPSLRGLLVVSVVRGRTFPPLSRIQTRCESTGARRGQSLLCLAVFRCRGCMI